MPSPFFFNEDVGATLNFVVRTPAGVAYDLTATTVELLVEGLDTFTCTVTGATDGEAEYAVQADEFPEGSYRAHLRITDGSDVLHTSVFKINVGKAIDPTSTPPVVVPPSGNPSQWAIPFGASGGGSYTEDATNLLFNDTTNSLLLFGGTTGTNGAKVLALGSGTAPSTSPADSIQLWAADLGGAGTAGLLIRDEAGNVLTWGRSTGWDAALFEFGDASTKIALGLHGDDGYVGTTTNDTLRFLVNNTSFAALDTSNNFHLGQGSSVGDNAAGVFVQLSGTAPTTAPADRVQHWTADRNGAGTVSPYIRTEDGGINERSHVVTLQSYDGTERTCTNGATDLSSHTVNIPAGDAFIVCGLFRKSAGAAATVSLGIKINTVQIIANFAVSNADNEAQMGTFSFGVENAFGVGRDTNYTQGPIFTARSEAAGTALAAFTGATYAAQLPTAAITSIVITGITGSASTTLGIKHVSVYRVSRS